jgi:AraC-like DNA-binding protein
MCADEYLTLRLVRLKSAEEWPSHREGLFFAFQKGGKGKCASGPHALQTNAGDILVMQGSPENKLRVEKGLEMAFWCFSLRLEHLFPIFTSHEISLLQYVTDSFKTARLFPASTALAMQCHKLISEVTPQFNLDHRSQLLRVAAVILTDEFRAAQNGCLGPATVEQRMVEVFEKMPSEQLLTLSVGELAVKFGCSRRHLNRLFHQFFGFSVGTLKMEMRLLKAISLLRDMNAKIINVAEQCGFNHLGLFNTCFKRRFGVSPGEWRKQSKASEGEIESPNNARRICSLESKGLCPLALAPQALVPQAVNSSLIRKPSGAQNISNQLPISSNP